MADKKISALPAATTPLAGTEVLPVVQGGATDQVSVANLTAGRTVNAGALNVNVASAYGSSKLSVNGDFTLADSMGLCWGTNATSFTGLLGNRSTGDVSIYTGGTERYTTNANGNLVVKTAAKGVNFTANTPAAGMTSQLLNWYEEGTWTPTIIGTSTAGTGTYTNQVGVYTRIGRQVTVSLSLQWSAHTGTGNMRIAGLPFTPANINYINFAATIGSFDSITLNAGYYPAAEVLQGETKISLLQFPTGGGGVASVAMDTAGYLTITATYIV